MNVKATILVITTFSGMLTPAGVNPMHQANQLGPPKLHSAWNNPTHRQTRSTTHSALLTFSADILEAAVVTDGPLQSPCFNPCRDAVNPLLIDN